MRPTPVITAPEHTGHRPPVEIQCGRALPAFDTVARDMPSSRPTRRRRVERREVRAARRARRFALLIVLAIVLVIALALSAFGGGSPAVQTLAPANAGFTHQTKPFPQIVALRGSARLRSELVAGAREHLRTEFDQGVNLQRLLLCMGFNP